MKRSRGMSGALFMAISALVLAGFPTTSIFTSSAAPSFSALPCPVKILPLASSRSERSMPFDRGRAPTSRAMFDAVEALVGSSKISTACDQREGAVVELHRDALERAHGVGDLDQVQDRRAGRAPSIVPSAMRNSSA